MRAKVQCHLLLADGASLRVQPSGVLLGRDPTCDLRSADPRVSRRHVLVRLVGDRAEAVPMSRNPVLHNRDVIAEPTWLADGDELRVASLSVRVRLTHAAPSDEAPSSWCLRRQKGGELRVSHSPFVIGGSPDDDLVVQGWPAEVVRLTVAQSALFAESCAEEIRVNGAPLPVESIVPLAIGDVLTHRDEELVVSATASEGTTVLEDPDELPHAALLQLMPRGGRLVLRYRGGERALYLPERRFDLVSALLNPPPPYRAGEHVPDDLLARLVWPRRADADRTDLNVLVYRVRRDLVEAGANGARLLERSPGGGATRFALAADATVTVE